MPFHIQPWFSCMDAKWKVNYYFFSWVMKENFSDVAQMCFITHNWELGWDSQLQYVFTLCLTGSKLNAKTQKSFFSVLWHTSEWNWLLMSTSVADCMEADVSASLQLIVRKCSFIHLGQRRTSLSFFLHLLSCGLKDI